MILNYQIAYFVKDFKDLMQTMKEEIQEQRMRKNQPSESELCETVILLKQIMPHRSLERAIILLHETLVKLKNPHEAYNDIQKSQGPNPEPDTQGEQQVVRTYKKEDLGKKNFTNDAECILYTEKRLIAKAFVGRQYGLEKAIQEIKRANTAGNIKVPENLTLENYKKLISATITESFRRLESFLIDDCKRPIDHRVTKQELKELITALISSTTFPEKKIIVFKKFVKLIYGLTNVTIMQKQSYDLYLTAMQWVTRKMKEKSLKSSEQKPKQMSICKVQQSMLTKGEDLFQIIDEYLHSYSLRKVLSKLEHKYNNIEELRAIFFSILRASLKRLFAEVEAKREIPQILQHLEQSTIQELFSARKALNLRKSLLLYYKNPSPKGIAEFVQLLAIFTSHKEQNKSVSESLIDYDAVKPQNQSQLDVKQEAEDTFMETQKS